MQRKKPHYTVRARFVVLLYLLLAPGASEALAQSAGAFTRMGFGARGMAMGNALVADGFGDASPYYNPALAASATRQNLEASAALMTFDRELQFLQFATPLRPLAGVAAGLTRAGVSDIDGRDESGYHTRTYETEEYAFFLAFGLDIGDMVTAGVSLQFFRSDLAEELRPADAFGLSLGLLARPARRLTVGVAVDDLLAEYDWDTTPFYDTGGRMRSDRFPVRLRGGAAYQVLEQRARLMLEYESRFREALLRRTAVRSDLVRHHESRVRMGGEVVLSEVIALRGGVDHLTGGAPLEHATPTAGFMIEQPAGNLMLRGEYAFTLEPYASGTLHVLTIRVYI